MKTGTYVIKSDKLKRALNNYLLSNKDLLINYYGLSKANAIITGATIHYPAIIPKIPFVDTPMYDSLLLLNSRMMALKKGMKKEGLEVEEFVHFQIESLRKTTARIPLFFKKMIGKIYLSGFGRFFLKRVGRNASSNGWPTKVIKGNNQDDFEMKITTQNCQMLNFMCSVGEEDIKPYCTFADFTVAETLGIGLKQISTIDSGTCSYCFYKKGKVHWPEAVSNVLNNAHKSSKS